jgi:hypothetical protein
MSHIVRCDRCPTEEHVMGTVSLPPGWQKVLGSDLCEPCCSLVREFIRFKPGQFVPEEPIPVALVESDSPVSDKLFETAPEPQVSADSREAGSTPAMGSSAHDSATVGEPEGKTQPASAENPLQECSTEETERTRKTRKKLQGQDAILPDKRNAPPQPGAPA